MRTPKPERWVERLGSCPNIGLFDRSGMVICWVFSTRAGASRARWRLDPGLCPHELHELSPVGRAELAKRARQMFRHRGGGEAELVGDQLAGVPEGGVGRDLALAQIERPRIG